MLNKLTDDLKYKSKYGLNHGEYQEGYRIVYFYPDESYKVGTFSGNIEDFMMDFVDVEPIENESDIPPFTTIDDLLNRYLLDVQDAKEVAIYKTDGTCIRKRRRK